MEKVVKDKVIKILKVSEVMVLSGMIEFTDKRYEWINLLTKDHFMTDLNKNIFEVIRDNKELGSYEMLTQIQDDATRNDYDNDDLFEFLDYAEAEKHACGGDKQIEKIIRYKLYRDVESKFFDINPYDPTEENITTLLEFVGSTKSNNVIYKSQQDCYIQLLSDFQNSKNMIAKTTGFKSYDSFTGGIVGGLHILAGRPGAGKTSYAIQLGLSFAQTNPDELVLFFSMEVNIQSISQKVVSNMSKIPLYKLKTYSLSPKESRRLEPGISGAKDNMIFIETNAISVSEIRHQKDHFEKKYGKKVGLIMTDYLQIMKPNSPKFNSEVEKVQNISGELRDLGKDVPTIALAQLNREGRDEDCPEPRNLKGSSQIEQDASTIVMLWRKDPNKQNEISCGIVKNRFGESFRFIEYDFDGSLSRFTPQGDELKSTDLIKFKKEIDF